MNKTALIANMMAVAQGNAGALNCLMGIVENPENTIYGITILSKCEEYEIQGDDLYILWNDLAGKNYKQMANICDKVPPRVLKDACSRQDYSGRELIAQFIV